MRPRELCGLALASALGCGEPQTCDAEVPHPEQPAATRENILLIVLDDLGTDQYPAYQAHPDPPTAPVLDTLAAEGVRFTSAYVSPSCSPTRASILTGRLPRRTGVGMAIQVESDFRNELMTQEVTIPELIRPLGYSSALVGKWHLSLFGDDPQPELDPIRHGFDHFRGILGNPVTSVQETEAPKDYFHWERVVDGTLGWSETYLTTAQVDDAIALIRTLPEPWFLMVALSAPHGPWHSPPEHLRRHDDPLLTVEDQYRAALEALDMELGRLFASVPGDFRETTHIVVIADNGTPDEGVRPPWPKARAKGSLYEGGIRVPLIVLGPQVAQPGSVNDALVHGVDVFATVADLAGVDLSESVGEDGSPLVVDGRSLLPHVRGEDDAARRQCVLTEEFGTFGVGSAAVIGERYKLVSTVRGGLELYDLARDGWTEGTDLMRGDPSAEAREAYRALRRELERYERSFRRHDDE